LNETLMDTPLHQTSESKTDPNDSCMQLSSFDAVV